MRLRRRLHQLLTATLESPRAHALGDIWIERKYRRALQRYRLGGQRHTHVLLLSPGGHNIGDQAMYEALLGHLTGRILVVCRAADSYYHPTPSAKQSLEILEVPNFWYRDGLKYARDAGAIAAALPSATSLHIVGADVVDGQYSQTASSRTWELAARWAEAGVAVRVLGFSWGPDTTPEIQSVVRSAVVAGVQCFVRDPLSHERFHTLFGAGHQSADMVFTYSPDWVSSDASLSAEEAKQRGQRVAVVNASALVANDVVQVPEYAAIIRSLWASNYFVILLPHVGHPRSDDRLEVAEIARALANEGLLTEVEELLTPAQIRSILRQTDVVVTGRMHLSILAMNLHVPSIVLTTKGKVEGLLAMAGVSGFCVQPSTGFSTDVIRSLKQLELEREQIVTTLEARVSAIRTLAERNFLDPTTATGLGYDMPELHETFGTRANQA